MELFDADEISRIRLAAFLNPIFRQRGAAISAGRACADLMGSGTAAIWANTFRKYQHSEVNPEAKSIWLMARCLRAGAGEDWCSGPIALDIAGKYRDLVLVVAFWRTRFGADVSRLIRALFEAGDFQECDQNEELLDLLDVDESDLADPDHLRLLSSFAHTSTPAKARIAWEELRNRSAARSAWILGSEAERSLQEAWECVLRGEGDSFYREPHIGSALAIAESKAIPLINKRSEVGIHLNLWCARPVQPEPLHCRVTDSFSWGHGVPHRWH